MASSSSDAAANCENAATGSDGIESESQLPAVAETVSARSEQHEIQIRTLEVAENRDRLEHDYAVRKLENEDRQDRRAYRLLIAGFVVVALLIFVLLYMTFFGNQTQSVVALRILAICGQAIGGGGFIFAVAYAINRLVRR